ncbi:MAG: thioredoxin [Burkholderiales bacterium]|nr:thioredoxin [Burkholderiales bacterium]
MMHGMEDVHVACLCAAWCLTCDDYRRTFDKVAAQVQATGAAPRWHWIDIEDEADLVGDFDVETFPTIVICDARCVRFAGPLTPQPQTLSRLLRAVLVDAAPDASWPALAQAVEDFARRLRDHKP